MYNEVSILLAGKQTELLVKIHSCLLVIVFLAACSGSEHGSPPVSSTLASTEQAGTWSKISPATDGHSTGGYGTSNIALLTDGRVLMSGPNQLLGINRAWNALTPDASGSYQNGTWALEGDSATARLNFPSFILRDGRYWIGGGEYDASYQQDTGFISNEIFDPVTNQWTSQPPTPDPFIDVPSTELADGRILVVMKGYYYIFTSFNAPSQWGKYELPNPFTSTRAPAITNASNEASSVLLPDGSVLMGEKGFSRYLPDSDLWVDTALPPAEDVSNTDEIGPMVLLPDGRVMVFFASGHNAIYTPPIIPTDPGSWSRAADTPEGLVISDSPAAVESNGRVLAVASSATDGWATPVFYEYEPATNQWSPAGSPPPVSASSSGVTPASGIRLLCLPNGQILVTGAQMGEVWLYTPAGGPQSNWKPKISSVTSTANVGEFKLTGLQLNGLTTGDDFGDDAKMATNYPLVFLTDVAGHVYFSRTYIFDQMAPRAGTIGSTLFTLPDNFPDGTYTLTVSANGVQSDPFVFGSIVSRQLSRPNM